MAKHLTKFFGEIDLDKLEEWYESEIVLNEKTVEISMTMSSVSKSLSPANFQVVDDYLNDLQNNENNIRVFIKDDFNEKGQTSDYIISQLKEQENEDITRLIKHADKKLNTPEKLLAVLQLLRIIFYPEVEDNMLAVFDYTIDKELTDDLLVFNLYKDNSARITIES